MANLYRFFGRLDTKWEDNPLLPDFWADAYGPPGILHDDLKTYPRLLEGGIWEISLPNNLNRYYANDCFAEVTTTWYEEPSPSSSQTPAPDIQYRPDYEVSVVPLAHSGHPRAGS